MMYFAGCPWRHVFVFCPVVSHIGAKCADIQTSQMKARSYTITVKISTGSTHVCVRYE